MMGEEDRLGRLGRCHKQRRLPVHCGGMAKRELEMMQARQTRARGTCAALWMSITWAREWAVSTPGAVYSGHSAVWVDNRDLNRLQWKTQE